MARPTIKRVFYAILGFALCWVAFYGVVGVGWITAKLATFVGLLPWESISTTPSGTELTDTFTGPAGKWLLFFWGLAGFAVAAVAYLVWVLVFEIWAGIGEAALERLGLKKKDDPEKGQSKVEKAE